MLSISIIIESMEKSEPNDRSDHFPGNFRLSGRRCHGAQGTHRPHVRQCTARIRIRADRTLARSRRNPHTKTNRRRGLLACCTSKVLLVRHRAALHHGRQRLLRIRRCRKTGGRQPAAPAFAYTTAYAASRHPPASGAGASAHPRRRAFRSACRRPCCGGPTAAWA